MLKAFDFVVNTHSTFVHDSIHRKLCWNRTKLPFVRFFLLSMTDVAFYELETIFKSFFVGREGFVEVTEDVDGAGSNG